MRKSLSVSLMALSLLPSLAFSNSIFYPCGHYRSEVWTLESEKIISLAPNCEAVPLHMGRAMAGNLEVDAWFGGYQRSGMVTDEYRIDHYDRCTGAWEGSEYKMEQSMKTFQFNVDNPNLKPGLPSYVSLAPLTPDGANAELPTALEKCSNFESVQGLL